MVCFKLKKLEMDELNRSLLNYSIAHDNSKKAGNDPNSWLVLAKESEKIITHLLQCHAKFIGAESGPHDSSSCETCKVTKTLSDKLNNDRISPSIPETAQENGESEGSAPGCLPASNSFGEDDDQFKAGSEHGSHESVPSSLNHEIKEVLTSDLPGTSDGVDDEQLRKGPALGSPSSTETSDKDEQSEEEDVTDPGEELRVQYKKANRKRYEKHKRYLLRIKPEESHESSVNNDPSNLDYVLTFDDAESKKIKHRFFEDEQQALKWAYENVYRRGKKNVFIKVWKLDEENSSSLKTDDLMINQIQLIHPVESEIVIKKQGMYDTGADFASFPFNLAIVETFINSATEINGELQLTVYGKLSINGKEGEKIYEIDMDNDKTWCNIGNRQIADLDDNEVEPILEKLKKVIYLKRTESE